MGSFTAILRAGAIALAAPAVVGCANTVIPPAEPERPAIAFLLDHGGSSSLVLEREDNSITRYSYGHWDWYVENRKGPVRGTGALLGSGTAGLGRRHLPGPANLDSVRQQVAVPIHDAWRFEVRAVNAGELHARFEALFEERADSLTDNPLYDLEFVPHPEPYGFGNNSNHMTARWLRALGCEVRMGGPFSIWELAGPP